MRPSHLISLRVVTGLLSRALVIFALLAQGAFFADHIGAMAGKALGNAPADARLGFLEICTGNGGVTIVAGEGTESPEHECPVCQSDAVAAFAAPAAMALPAFAFIPIDMAREIPRITHVAAAWFPGSHPIRGPPVMRS